MGIEEKGWRKRIHIVKSELLRGNSWRLKTKEHIIRTAIKEPTKNDLAGADWLKKNSILDREKEAFFFFFSQHPLLIFMLFCWDIESDFHDPTNQIWNSPTHISLCHCSSSHFLLIWFWFWFWFLIVTSSSIWETKNMIEEVAVKTVILEVPGWVWILIAMQYSRSSTVLWAGLGLVISRGLD